MRVQVPSESVTVETVQLALGCDTVGAVGPVKKVELDTGNGGEVEAGVAAVEDDTVGRDGGGLLSSEVEPSSKPDVDGDIVSDEMGDVGPVKAVELETGKGGEVDAGVSVVKLPRNEDVLSSKPDVDDAVSATDGDIVGTKLFAGVGDVETDDDKVLGKTSVVENKVVEGTPVGPTAILL